MPCDLALWFLVFDWLCSVWILPYIGPAEIFPDECFYPILTTPSQASQTPVSPWDQAEFPLTASLHHHCASTLYHCVSDIDKLLWHVSGFTTHHLQAACGQIWACEDTFGYFCFLEHLTTLCQPAVISRPPPGNEEIISRNNALLVPVLDNFVNF